MLSHFKCSRLSNGVTLASMEMPHMTSVSLGIWVSVGGRFEPASLNGVSHFIEHMLFKGTARRSAKEISQEVEGAGGYINAFTTEEGTCFYAKACHQQLPDLADVLLDMFLESRFDAHELRKEREVIKEEVAMYLDQPQQHVQEVLSDLLWPDHPLGRSLTGTPASLDRLRRTELVDFLKKNYVSGSTWIIAAGHLRHEQLVKAVRKGALRIPEGRRPTFQPVREEQEAPRIRCVSKKVEQTQIAIGIRTCSRHDERRHPLRLLNTILGENMSSRLFQVVREEAALAYSICSSLSFYDDVGILSISAGLDTDNLNRAMKLIMRELRRLSEKAPSPSEMRRARDYINGQIDLSLENTENQMMWIGEHLLAYGRMSHPREIQERLSEVTPAQVRRVAQDFLQPSRTCMALVSSDTRTDRLMKHLRS